MLKVCRNGVTKGCAIRHVGFEEISKSFMRMCSPGMKDKRSRACLPMYLQLHDDWVQKFMEAQISEPEESAGFIFAHLLKKKMFSHIPIRDLKRKMKRPEIAAVGRMCQKRLKSMPIQYVIGEWDFFGSTLEMRQPVFIPRPETERLVEHVLGAIKNRLDNSKKPPLQVLEIGCGTGAISLALLSTLRDENVKFTAIDKTKCAVELTHDNMALLGLDKTEKLNVFHHCLGKEKNGFPYYGSSFDVIVSNPPYIPTADMKVLPKEISGYEDRDALHGGIDGLDVIREILCHCDHMLSSKGSLWLEVDPSHPALLAENPGKSMRMVASYEDMFGKSRFCHLSKT